MKIIIAGAGAVGTHLAKLLSRDHQDCILVDEDENRLEGLDTEYDIMTLQGSPTSIKTLKEAGKCRIICGRDPRREHQHECQHLGACLGCTQNGGSH